MNIMLCIARVRFADIGAMMMIYHLPTLFLGPETTWNGQFSQ